MRILITGANGQLGKELQKELKRRNIAFTPTDFLPNEKRRYDWQMAFLSGNTMHLDITNLVEVKDFVKGARPDVIINCAAYNAVDKAEEDWRNAFSVNAIGPKNLTIIANEFRIPLMHFSTDYVFDGKKGSPYFVWDEPKPLSKYGQSKLYGEQLVSLFSNRCFVVRLSWVFGAGNTNFVKKILECSKGKDELKVVDDQISSPSYTVDLSMAIIDLLETGAYGSYHITNTGYCSRYEWAKYVLELSGWSGRLIPVKSTEFKTAAERPGFSAMDDFPLRETIGYELPYWREATERFLKELEVL